MVLHAPHETTILLASGTSGSKRGNKVMSGGKDNIIFIGAWSRRKNRIS